VAERHSARWPLMLIGVSLVCVLLYHMVLHLSVLFSTYTFTGLQPTFDEVVQSADPLDIPMYFQPTLILLYLGIFVAAEAAFVLMAIKEYLQNYLKLEDARIIIEDSQTEVAGSDCPPSSPQISSPI